MVVNPKHYTIQAVALLACLIAFGSSACSLPGQDEQPASPRSTAMVPTAEAGLDVGAGPLEATNAVLTPTGDEEARPTTAAEASESGGASNSLIDAVERVTSEVRPAVALIAVQRASPEDAASVTPRQGVGSGVVYDPDGFVLTNNHVVQGARRIAVVLPDGREFEGRIVGRDPRTDLAVLKIDGGNLPTAPLGDSSELAIGEWVVAIGNALGLPGGPTTTAGVVGALDRTIRAPNGLTLSDLIQTDASINPGNSGGPLVNLRGEVVGINTAGATTPGGAQAPGIGFAININRAKSISQELMQRGRVARAYLGVTGITITPAISARLGLPVDSGFVVVDVEQESPAGRADLSRGDVIVAIDGEPVQSEQGLRQAIESRSPGDRITLTVVRAQDGREELVVRLGETPPLQESPGS